MFFGVDLNDIEPEEQEDEVQTIEMYNLLYNLVVVVISGATADLSLADLLDILRYAMLGLDPREQPWYAEAEFIFDGEDNATATPATVLPLLHVIISRYKQMLSEKQAGEDTVDNISLTPGVHEISV